MIREERELLTELARLNRDMAPLCMRIMDRSAGVDLVNPCGRPVGAGGGVRGGRAGL